MRQLPAARLGYLFLILLFFIALSAVLTFHASARNNFRALKTINAFAFFNKNFQADLSLIFILLFPFVPNAGITGGLKWGVFALFAK